MAVQSCRTSFCRACLFFLNTCNDNILPFPVKSLFAELLTFCSHRRSPLDFENIRVAQPDMIAVGTPERGTVYRGARKNRVVARINVLREHPVSSFERLCVTCFVVGLM